MSSPKSKSYLAIVGPTGVGKTAYGLHLGQAHQIEIISVDSRQIYAGMDIATGKETSQGQWRNCNNRPTLYINDIAIHGLNIIKPDQDFTVSDWLAAIVPIVTEIEQRQHIPLFIGGTGFYFNALLGKIDTLNIPPNPELRQKLGTASVEFLQKQLREVNPIKFNQMNTSDNKNPARLIRAIEIAEVRQNDSKVKVESSLTPRVSSFTLQLLGLTKPNHQLYAQVDQRIDSMISQGLIHETEQLLKQYQPQLQAMSGIGYREIIDMLHGKTSQDQAIQLIKNHTHDYIRRQQTWWRKQSVNWFDTSTPDWQTNADHRSSELLSSR